MISLSVLGGGGVHGTELTTVFGGGWYAARPGFFATVGCINQKKPNASAASIPNEAANAPVTAAASAKRELLESKIFPKKWAHATIR
jgi:hypothetical protein